jgi:hypothetical protein
MITINHYTGNWQRALSPKPKAPRVGSLVRIHDLADAREIDDFRACLFAAGLQIGSFERYFSRLKMGAYRIECFDR